MQREHAENLVGTRHHHSRFHHLTARIHVRSRAIGEAAGNVPSAPLTRLSGNPMMPLRSLTFIALITLALPLRTPSAQSLRGSRASVHRMYSYARRHDLVFYETGRGV